MRLLDLETQHRMRSGIAVYTFTQPLRVKDNQRAASEGRAGLRFLFVSMHAWRIGSV